MHENTQRHEEIVCWISQVLLWSNLYGTLAMEFASLQFLSGMHVFIIMIMLISWLEIVIQCIDGWTQIRMQVWA